jgi:hypothetical protein
MTSVPGDWLAPAYGEVPAQAAFVGLAQDAGVLLQLFEDLWALGAELVGFVAQRVDESVDGSEALGAEVPLGGRQALDQRRSL